MASKSADLSERRAGEIDELSLSTYLLAYLGTYILRLTYLPTTYILNIVRGGPGGNKDSAAIRRDPLRSPGRHPRPPGPWSLAPGPWSLVPGPWSLAPGPWPLVPGPLPLSRVPCPWPAVPGPLSLPGPGAKTVFGHNFRHMPPFGIPSLEFCMVSRRATFRFSVPGPKIGAKFGPRARAQAAGPKFGPKN